MSVGNMDGGIKCILSKFSGEINLCDMFTTLEERYAIQRALDRLERWASENLMKFIKNECKIRHLDQDCLKYKLSGEWNKSGPDDWKLLFS